MHYSTASAGLFLLGALFMLPGLLLGAGSLAAAITGRTCIHRLSGTKARLVHALIGVLLTGAFTASMTHKVYETYVCRTAESKGHFITVAGQIRIINRFFKPGTGYVDFMIGDRAFHTYEDGLSCDCGFISPLGKHIRLKDGMFATAKVADGKIVDITIAGDGK